MATAAASPVALHCLDVPRKALGQTDTKDLEEGDGHKDPSHNNQVVPQPLHELAHASAFGVDGAPLLQLQFEPGVLATLSVEDTFHRVPDIAGEEHPAALLAGVQGSAVEINIEFQSLGPQALQQDRYS